jgi:hypothetical protein
MDKLFCEREFYCNSPMGQWTSSLQQLRSELEHDERTVKSRLAAPANDSFGQRLVKIEWGPIAWFLQGLKFVKDAFLPLGGVLLFLLFVAKLRFPGHLLVFIAIAGGIIIVSLTGMYTGEWVNDTESEIRTKQDDRKKLEIFRFFLVLRRKHLQFLKRLVHDLKIDVDPDKPASFKISPCSIYYNNSLTFPRLEVKLTFVDQSQLEWIDHPYLDRNKKRKWQARSFNYFIVSTHEACELSKAPMLHLPTLNVENVRFEKASILHKTPSKISVEFQDFPWKPIHDPEIPIRKLNRWLRTQYTPQDAIRMMVWAYRKKINFGQKP